MSKRYTVGFFVFFFPSSFFVSLLSLPRSADDTLATPPPLPSVCTHSTSDLVSKIQDPEHPFSLGQLAVVNLPDITLDPPPGSVAASCGDSLVHVRVDITPTVSHCSHATVIGLAVRVRLERCLPPNYRVEVCVKESTHAQDDQVTKQLADKERVAAALENSALVSVLDSMLKDCDL